MQGKGKCDEMKTPQFYIAAQTKKKRWLAFCWALAAVVVFCTVYALILPGVSASRDTICGVEAHEHSALCYAPDENATLTALPEEEREAVQCLITQIDGLPAPTELEEVLAAWNEEVAETEAEAETDTETATEAETESETATPKSRDDFIAALSAQIAAMEEAFLALSPAQQETVENWPKLMETKQQLCYLDYGERIAALGEEDEAAKEELKLALDDAYAAAALNDATYSELMALLLPPETAAEEAETDSEHEAASEDEAPAEETETTGEEVTSEEGAYSPQAQSTTVNAVSDGSGVQPQASTPQAVTDPKYTKDDGPSADNKKPSDLQVDNYGGTNATDDVSVSKTIRGTELENVFDITLKVETTQKIEEVTSEPDMAVVIVMDISHTMKEHFGGGTEGNGVTRYAAAMDAAEDFLDKFVESNTLGVSKVGYVAFNTDAHEIFDLQPCTDATQANALKNTMQTETGKIINANGYGVAHNRFTNIEGGLKMASDMLNEVSNKNKYIILLTDGFSTTYLESGYKGYDPYDTTGRFYDHVLNVPCSSGTSYSDEAAIRARNMAKSVKDNGIGIFSIGVDIGGQTIQKYIEDSEKLVNDDKKISIVDRTGTSYEIGSATDKEAYKNWLENSIGSGDGYYYDSTDSGGLKNAYEEIFAKIEEEVETASKADWVASDSIQDLSQTDVIEFIGFYNKSEKLISDNLRGSYTENGENTASLIKKESQTETDKISWDLKKSGYTTSTKDNITYYTYQLTYRVRLTNEATGFEESEVYNTNGTTMLQYRVVQSVNGNDTMQSYEIPFPIPSVYGYLGELTFQKVDSYGASVSGAEFMLSHDIKCNVCHGDSTAVTISDMKATSNEDGKVTFSNIPSGHTYTLTETKVPAGYSESGDTYSVVIAYDMVTVTVTNANGESSQWGDVNDYKIINITSHELPATGGMGKEAVLGMGVLLALGALLLLRIRKPSKSR